MTEKAFRDIWIDEWESVRGAAICNWCGAEATHIVGRTSNLTDKHYADPACRKHAEEWGLEKDGKALGRMYPDNDELLQKYIDEAYAPRYRALTSGEYRMLYYLERHLEKISIGGQLARIVRVDGKLYLHVREGRYLSVFRIASNGDIASIPYYNQPKRHTWKVIYRYDEPVHTPEVDLSDVSEPDVQAVANYEERVERRKERLEGLADEHAQESERRFTAAREAVAQIPPGQPILVGHHSERPHRAALKRSDNHMRKGIEHHNLAQDYARRAAKTGTDNAIRSDDPAVLQKLAARIEERERWQETMKKANSIVRGKSRTDKERVEDLVELLGWPETKVVKLLTPDFAGRKGFPDYELRNNGAQIRADKQRFAELKTQQSRPEVSVDAGSAIISENAKFSSVEIKFPDKPSEAILTELKRRGWRWARTSKVWYKKQRTDAVIAEAREIVEVCRSLSKSVEVDKGKVRGKAK